MSIELGIAIGLVVCIAMRCQATYWYRRGIIDGQDIANVTTIDHAQSHGDGNTNIIEILKRISNYVGKLKKAPQ